MADPRTVGPQLRKSGHSPLMEALSKKGPGDIVNFCPFGCEDHELDDNGWCGHLIGFYDKGQTYEPRVRRKADSRVIVSGKKREPMQRGYKLVRITTTARVYSPNMIDGLTIKRSKEDEALDEIVERERVLLEQAEAVRNPVLEGDWSENPYEIITGAAAAAT